MTNTNSDTLIINTGLNDRASLNVLKSTLGQLSDGIWENNSVARHYWKFADVKMIGNQVCLVIDKDTFDGHWCPTENFFKTRLSFDPAAIKKYFAKKIQAVVRQEAKDYPEAGIKFTAKCDASLDYMYDYDNHDNKIRACDAYKVYKALKAA
jgi:hypothetical protein